MEAMALSSWFEEMVKGKLDVSDRYGAKMHRSHCLTVNVGPCILMTRKYVIFTAYVSMIAVSIFLLYCAIWLPDLKLWCKFGESNQKGKNVDSFLVLREKERASYDKLMRYILHPQAPCLTVATIGGKKRRNKMLDGDKVICLEPGPGLSEECIVYSFGY
ncbi:uncharacterized protein LOC118195681 [Stegodyphus dumicola]|uniref:uncharacterized protein LOC118195681 n=1 Tax=Stegodyphus dumicola TaxID=202533 RepID=UPI0015A94D12|nr:uncharacterized protein LOC118195681 [Stegodyphus dumicola]